MLCWPIYATKLIFVCVAGISLSCSSFLGAGGDIGSVGHVSCALLAFARIANSMRATKGYTFSDGHADAAAGKAQVHCYILFSK